MPFFTGLILLVLFQNPPAYKIDAEYIKVPVTVLGENNQSITGLTREDFQLFDEGEARPIHNFVLDEMPIHVVFLLDSSASLKEEIQEIQYAALRFAQAFGPEDRLAVFSFSDGITLLQDWTNSYKKLRKSLKKLKKGYRTALYDALLQTASEKLRKVSGKRVIILLTDGLDNESEASYANVMNELIASNTVLYIVSRTRLIQPKVGESERIEFLNRVMKTVLDEDEDFVEIYFRLKEKSMNYLAETSGGRVFYPEQLNELGENYLQIARELKSQYVLTFLPARESQPRFRAIKVICNSPVQKIFHRQLYRVP
jgi:Ca-activated chloride channel family protein